MWWHSFKTLATQWQFDKYMEMASDGFVASKASAIDSVVLGRYEDMIITKSARQELVD